MRYEPPAGSRPAHTRMQPPFHFCPGVYYARLVEELRPLTYGLVGHKTKLMPKDQCVKLSAFLARFFWSYLAPFADKRFIRRRAGSTRRLAGARGAFPAMAQPPLSGLSEPERALAFERFEFLRPSLEEGVRWPAWPATEASPSAPPDAGSASIDVRGLSDWPVRDEATEANGISPTHCGRASRASP